MPGVRQPGQPMGAYVRKTGRQTKPEGKAAVLTPEAMGRLFSEDGFQTDRDRALFGLCRYTAARISEVCQMKLSDVLMPDGTVKSMTCQSEASICFPVATV